MPLAIKKNNGTFVKPVRPLNICGQYDICFLLGNVLILSRFEECKDSARTWCGRYLCVDNYRTC